MAFEKYSGVNIYTKTKDVALIKPKTTVQNRNEFNVSVERTAQNLSENNYTLFDKWLVKKAE
jgi:hypothetical protein